jgi:hypothetical protein
LLCEPAEHFKQLCFTALAVGTTGAPQFLTLPVDQQGENVLFVSQVQGCPEIIFFEVQRNRAFARLWVWDACPHALIDEKL